MSRNLLKNSYGSPYGWTSSDAKTQVDCDTPGQVSNLSTAYTNAYFWLYNDSNAEYRWSYVPIHDLVQNYDTLTLSVDIKVTGDADHVSARLDVRYNDETGHNIYDCNDEAPGNLGKYLTGITDWTRIHLKVRTTHTGKNGEAALFCIFFQPGCTAGTTVQWRNMKLEVGDTGSEWTPAPEEVLCQRLEESDVEPGAISVGNTVIAGNTLASMKSDGSWLTTRVRTKNIIPLMGKKAFYVGFSANLVCFPIYFDASDLSVAAPCDAHSTDDVFVAPQGAVGVELVFRKSDSSAITPTEVTNVTGGGTH